MFDDVSHHSLERLSRFSSPVESFLLVVETRVVDARGTSDTVARFSVRNKEDEENKDLQNVDVSWNIGESGVSSMRLVSSTVDR